MERSPLALHAKAAALYSEARRLASKFDACENPLQIISVAWTDAALTDALPGGWTQLDKRVGQFVHELPELDGLQQSAPQNIAARRLLVVHILSCGAIIELHEPLERSGTGAAKALPAALDIVQVLNHAVDARSSESLVDSMVGVRLIPHRARW